MFNNFLLKIVPFKIRKKFGRGRQATSDNIMRMSFACWITKNKDTFRAGSNTSCFSMTTMVTRTTLDVTLNVHFLFYVSSADWFYSVSEQVFMCD
jgi:hypothetical protein